jgi:hypothetical protein
VVDEVRELGAGDLAVEPAPEGDAARVRMSRASHLEAREQIDRVGEERPGARRLGLHRLPEAHAPDVLQQEQAVLAGAIGVQRRHREAVRRQPASDVHER